MIPPQKKAPQRVTVATDLLADQPQGWANLGLWSAHPQDVGQPSKMTYPEACMNLAKAHGDAAGFRSEHKLLDVAAGRGGSLVFWHDAYGLQDMDALEPAQGSIELIRGLNHHTRTHLVGKVFAHPLEAYGDSQGDTQPFPWGRYDRVVCLDSAYHFPSNHEFLRFGQLALKKGGLLVWSNFYYDQPPKPLATKLLSWAGINPAAIINSQQFLSVVQNNGFKILSTRALDGGVMQGFARFVKARRHQLPWRIRLQKSWWTIEATAAALEYLDAHRSLGDGLGYGLYVLEKVNPPLGNHP